MNHSRPEGHHGWVVKVFGILIHLVAQMWDDVGKKKQVTTTVPTIRLAIECHAAYHDFLPVDLVSFWLQLVRPGPMSFLAPRGPLAHRGKSTGKKGWDAGSDGLERKG